MKNKFWLMLLVCSTMSACTDTVEKLKRVGKAPDFQEIGVPVVEEDEDDIARRQTHDQQRHAHMRKTNSLWQPGSTKFFRDSRAWKVGDIIKVVVEIKDNATLNNSTQQTRKGKDSLGIPHLFGQEKAIKANLSTTADLGKLIGVNSQRDHNGSGSIARKEDIKTEIAATVTKVLPGGNLIIHGHQEVRVNYELREIKVAGIIRPKDIASDNSIKTNQIAEARISYGGRGIMSDVQQPRVGSQVIDIISPF